MFNPIKNNNILRYLTFSFAVVFTLCITPTNSHASPQAEKGVLDLRNWDFEENGAVEISGEWEFHWSTFLDPEAKVSTQKPPGYIQVPGTWLQHKQDNKILGKYGYASFRLKILMPEDRVNLGLYLKRAQDAYRVYINGQLWMEAGRPGQSPSEAVTHITREYSSLKGVKGDLDILFHMSNYSSYAGGGFFNSFSIGPEGDQHLKHLIDLSADFFLAGALICLGLFMATLHIGRLREKAYFVLYVMSFTAAVYVITSNATLMHLFPDLSYYWTERMSYISGTFLLALTYEFIHQVHSRKTSRVISHIIMYFAAAISIYIIFWPKGLPIELIYCLGLLLLIVSISCLVEVLHMLRNKASGRWFITTGVAILILAGAHDLLNASGIILSVYLGPYSILLLLILYAAILAVRVNTSIIQNEQLAKAIWSLNDAVAIFDNRDHVVIWNDAYVRHLSTAAQKILKPGASFIDLVNADAFSGELDSANGRESNYIKERMLRHYHPGTAFEMERHSGWYLYREAETPDGGRITLAADLTPQKLREAELKKAFAELVAANEAKNSFLSNMSHELRTPLNAIIGFSDMMVKEVLGSLNSQYVEYSGHINRSGQHLLRLVTDMLDVARIETGKLQVTPEEFQLAPLLDDCLKMEKDKVAQSQLELKTSIPDDLPSLYADPVRVRQIVLNLLDNAIKFTKPGGKITVSVSENSAGDVAISIEDTGIGIAKEHIETALQKFGQIRQSHMNTHEGLGLGLSIAQILMQLHGGTLELKSEVGVGTQVTAIFPLQSKTERQIGTA